MYDARTVYSFSAATANFAGDYVAHLWPEHDILEVDLGVRCTITRQYYWITNTDYVFQCYAQTNIQQNLRTNQIEILNEFLKKLFGWLIVVDTHLIC